MSGSTVSIIIPNYNGARFVAEAVNCALLQTFSPLEIVVIDDASKDQSEEIIRSTFTRELANGRLRFERNERNRERSFSRNRGAELARGEYICFLDHDDLWSKEYIASVMEIFERTSCDAVYSFPRTFVNENGELIRRSAKRISADSAELIFASQVGYPSATAFRRTSFLGYTEDCILREDWEIFLRGYLAGQHICIQDNDVVKIRAHDGRTSNSVKFWSSTLRVYKQYLERIPLQYRNIFLYHVVDVCLRYGDLPRGWHLSMMAMKSGMLPDVRMIQRLFTRGIRVDRYLSLAAERRKFGAGDVP